MAHGAKHAIDIAEEQRDFRARISRSLGHGGLGVARHVDEVVAISPAAQPRNLRARQALQQHRQADPDRQQQPMQHTHQQHAGKGGQRDQPVAPPVEIRLEAARIEAMPDRADHDGREYRLRRVRDQGSSVHTAAKTTVPATRPARRLLRAGFQINPCQHGL